MLTFEKVLEIFADYLTADETIEVYISRHGCVRVEFDQDFHYCSGEVCHTPKELFDLSRSFFADSSYMLSFSVLCSCVCSRLISPSVSSWHKQNNTLMHQSPGHIQRRTPYSF